MKSTNRVKISEVTAPIIVIFIATIVVGLIGGSLGLLIVLVINSRICN